MSNSNSKLEKFKQLLELLNDGVDKQSFLESFKKVVDHVFKVEAKLIEKIGNETQEEKKKLETLELEFGQIIEQAKKDSDSTFAGFKRRTIEAINQLFSRNEVNKKLSERLEMINGSIKTWSGMIDDKITEADERLSHMREGNEKELHDLSMMFEEHKKEMNEMYTTVERLEREHDEMKEESPELEIESVKGLKKELEDLRNIRTRVGGGGTSAIGVAQAFKWIAHTEEPVGAINGTNKIYTVKNTIWWIAGFMLNGEQIAELPNFTFSGKTITFTTAIPAAYSGKDFECKYIGT